MAELLSFGAWLRLRRHELDLTQEEMAERIGYQGDTIRKIEYGIRRPSKQLAELLGDFFQIPSSELPDFVHFARFSDEEQRLFQYPHSAADDQPVSDDTCGSGQASEVENEPGAGADHDAGQTGGRWSPSLAVLIPGSLTEALHWDEHTTVEPKIADGKLVIEAVEAIEV